MSMMDAKIVTLNFLSETSNSERFTRKRNPIDRKSRLETQISFSKRESVVIMTECYKLRERVKVIGRFFTDYISCNLQTTVLSSKSDVTCRHYDQVYKKKSHSIDEITLI